MKTKILIFFDLGNQLQKHFLLEKFPEKFNCIIKMISTISLIRIFSKDTKRSSSDYREIRIEESNYYY